MATTHYEFHSDFARRYYGEGPAEGRAASLFDLLRLRGFPVPEPEHQRALACRDLEQLDVWIARVLTARDLDEVLGERRPRRRSNSPSCAGAPSRMLAGRDWTRCAPLDSVSPGAPTRGRPSS